MQDRPSYFQRRINSFRFAGKGIWAFIRTEEHAQIHVLAAALVVAMGFWAGLARWEWCAVIACMGLVFASEMANSAVERLTDLVHPHFDHRAGRVKDIAAGGVLVAATAAAAIAVVVFWDKF